MAPSGFSQLSPVSGMAGRYASALFALASEANAADRVGAELTSFQAMIDGSADLQRLVRSPVFSGEEQAQAIAALLKKAGIEGIGANFLKLVAAKRRLFAVSDMIRDYHALNDAAKGLVRVDVRLAETPSPRVFDDIKAALKDVAKAEIDVTLTVDPSLIGGIVVKMGSRMVDASLKTKLNSIRLAMKGAA